MCVVYRFLTYQKWFSHNLDLMNMGSPETPVYHQWDPIRDSSDCTMPLMASASMRIKKDLMSIYKDPPPGIFVTACDSDIRNIHALIIGPMDTPYEGGMFYFFLRCPYDFPIKPPKVRFMTTDAGNVRFNPNLYQNGKVCLSIIGTWIGPGWTPAQQISSLLISIQSLMNDNPIYNEPGRNFRPNEAAEYSDMIIHETIRVAVLGMVNNECQLSMPPEFAPIMERTFLQYFDVYVEICNKKMHLNGRKCKDPIFLNGGCVFNFKYLLTKLNETKDRLLNEMKKEKEGKPSSSAVADKHIDETNVREFLDISNDSSDIPDLDYYDLHDTDESSEDENIGSDDDNIRSDDDMIKSDDDKIKSDDDKIKSDDDKIKSDDDKVKSDDDKVKSDDDKIKSDDDKIKSDDDKIKSDNDKIKSDDGKIKSDDDITS